MGSKENFVWPQTTVEQGIFNWPHEVYLTIRDVSDDILSISVSIVRTFIPIFSPLLQH